MACKLPELIEQDIKSVISFCFVFSENIFQKCDELGFCVISELAPHLTMYLNGSFSRNASVVIDVAVPLNN